MGITKISFSVIFNKETHTLRGHLFSASLSSPGGRDKIISSTFPRCPFFFYSLSFFLKFTSFLFSFWSPGRMVHPPGKKGPGYATASITIQALLKKMSAWGANPWPPPRGSAPWILRYLPPPNNLPWCYPVSDLCIQYEYFLNCICLMILN